MTDCDLQTAARLTNRLKEKGYLISTASRGLKSSSHLNKVKCTIVKNGDVFQRLLRDYFDPTKNIAHHVSLYAFCSHTLLLYINPLYSQFVSFPAVFVGEAQVLTQVPEPPSTCSGSLDRNPKSTRTLRPRTASVGSPRAISTVLTDLSVNIATPSQRKGKHARNNDAVLGTVPSAKRRRMRSSKSKDYLYVGNST